jgi:hypothetical protein
LNNIGLDVGDDYDVYYVNGPSSGVGNGIGGRATALHLYDPITERGYDDILYTSGNLGVNTIANGDYNNDAGDDVGVLTDWFDTGGKDIFLTGDDLASDLSQAGTATLNWLEVYMGAKLTVSDVRTFIDNQATPKVLPTPAVPGNPVFALAPSWIAYGGCNQINTFDGVEVINTGQRIAEFNDPIDGSGYVYNAATLNLKSGGKIVSLPYDLMYVYTDPSAPANVLPARTRLLWDVLIYFGIPGDSGNASPVLPGIAFQTSNYPNPFNPSTTIKYSMPKAGHLKLSVYNVRGQLVKTLIDGTRPAGADQTIVWDGTNNQGGSVASGVYFYEARTGGDVKVKKMALVK